MDPPKALPASLHRIFPPTLARESTGPSLTSVASFQHRDGGGSVHVLITAKIDNMTNGNARWICGLDGLRLRFDLHPEFLRPMLVAFESLLPLNLFATTLASIHEIVLPHTRRSLARQNTQYTFAMMMSS